MSEQKDGLLFRPFQQADQKSIRKLILDGLGDHFPVVDEGLNPDLAHISANYVEKGHKFLIAELNGRIVGAGALKEVDSHTGRIVRVSVDKDHRRQGIGIALVHRLVARGREIGYKNLLVETNHDWEEANALYRRCGFLPYTRDEVSIHMRLNLGQD